MGRKFQNDGKADITVEIRINTTPEAAWKNIPHHGLPKKQILLALLPTAEVYPRMIWTRLPTPVLFHNGWNNNSQ